MTSVAQTASDMPRVMSFVRSKNLDLPDRNVPGIGNGGAIS
jgi:hypothetical protein